MQEALEIKYLENPLREYLICVCILIFGFLLKRLFANLISKQTFRIFKGIAKNQYYDQFLLLFRTPFEQLISLIILYAAFSRLNFPETWHIDGIEKFGVRWVIEAVYEIALITVITKLVLKSADFIAYVLTESDVEHLNLDLIRFLKELSKIVIVIFSIFVTLRLAFEVNITALIASLGIGGLAIALAAQDTIANLFGSFIIYLDKPFKVGDQIEVSDVKGIVERVGFRTTRVRTLDRSLVTVPNKKMVDSTLNNISLSEERRVKFMIQLTYESKSVDILKIIDEIKNAITKNEDTSDELNVNFTDFDSSSLSILVIYFVTSNLYDKKIEVKQAINIQIMEIVERNNCKFAYPTQRLFLEKE
jgi:MscS family membrane protein